VAHERGAEGTAGRSVAKLVVGVAEMALSDSPGDEIVTHALGSCVGLAMYDPTVRAGGILHYMLPTSTIAPEKAAGRPCMFADTGVRLFLQELARLGANTRRLVVKVAGGAQIMDERGVFNVGRRNCIALRQIFWRAGILIDVEDVGGMKARTMSLEIASGAVWVRSNGVRTQL
jgi:chemotaxis protein CheD